MRDRGRGRTYRLLFLLVALVLGLALTAAACGGDDEGGGEATTDTGGGDTGDPVSLHRTHDSVCWNPAD